jgi:hypothetical protein
VLEDRLLFSSHVEELEKYLRFLEGGAQDLAGSPSYRRVAAALPTLGSGAHYFVDQRKQAQATLKQLMAARGILSMWLGSKIKEAPPELQPLLGSFDWQALPDPEVLARYMSVGGASLIPEPDGLTIVGVSMLGKEMPE